MLNLWKQLALSHTVASQFIGHDHARHILKAFKQSSEESFGRSGMPSWLNEDVEHDAVLINGAPQIVLHPSNPDEHLVHVPLVPRPWPAPPHAVREGLAKLLAPPTDRLI